MRSLLALALAACLLAACRPDTAALPESTPIAAVESSPTPAPAADPGARPFLQPGRIFVQSASLSLVVEDPVRSMSRIESAISEVGGVVVSSSSWSSPGSPASASLSARIPPEELGNLRRIAAGLASQIQNDGLYSQDATAEVRRLTARLHTLERAEARLLKLLTQGGDPDLAESLMIAHQMVTEEREAIQAQIADYEDRAALATFDVSLNGMAQVLLVE